MWSYVRECSFACHCGKHDRSLRHNACLRGCVTVLEIVFAGQCEVFVLILYTFSFFFPLATKLIGP